MSITLTIRDAGLVPGDEDHVFELEFPSESVTVRELIRARVYQEVDDYNRNVRTGREPVRYSGLVTPDAAERELNGERRVKRTEVDWRLQFEAATTAYEQRRILVLVGDHQTQALDETIWLRHDTEVTFLRLMPLVGG